MAHFESLEGVTVSAKVLASFYMYSENFPRERAWEAVRCFVERWGRYIDDWRFHKDEDSEGEPCWVIEAEIEDAPARMFGGGFAEVLKDGDSWCGGDGMDEWWFGGVLDGKYFLAEDIAKEMAEDALLPEIGNDYGNTGFGVTVTRLYVSDLNGQTPVE